MLQHCSITGEENKRWVLNMLLIPFEKEVREKKNKKNPLSFTVHVSSIMQHAQVFCLVKVSFFFLLIPLLFLDSVFWTSKNYSCRHHHHRKYFCCRRDKKDKLLLHCVVLHFIRAESDFSVFLAHTYAYLLSLDTAEGYCIDTYTDRKRSSGVIPNEQIIITENLPRRSILKYAYKSKSTFQPHYNGEHDRKIKTEAFVSIITTEMSGRSTLFTCLISFCTSTFRRIAFPAMSDTTNNFTQSSYFR